MLDVVSSTGKLLQVQSHSADIFRLDSSGRSKKWSREEVEVEVEMGMKELRILWPIYYGP